MSKIRTRGFLVAYTPEYGQLTNVLLKSLERFSVHSVHTVELEPKIGVMAVERRMREMLNTPFDLTCVLDADTVAFPEIDKIWSHARDLPYTLHSPHPSQPPHDWMKAQVALGGPFETISQYRHTVPCLYTRRAIPYVLEVYKAFWSFRCYTTGEEAFWNLLAWKHGIEDYLPYLIVDRKMRKQIDARDCIGVHGERDPNKADAILQTL